MKYKADVRLPGWSLSQLGGLVKKIQRAKEIGFYKGSQARDIHYLSSINT